MIIIKESTPEIVAKGIATLSGTHYKFRLTINKYSRGGRDIRIQPTNGTSSGIDLAIDDVDDFIKDLDDVVCFHHSGN
jgi:hypothetical protein